MRPVYIRGGLLFCQTSMTCVTAGHHVLRALSSAKYMGEEVKTGRTQNPDYNIYVFFHLGSTSLYNSTCAYL